MEAEEIAKLVKGLRLSADAREGVVMITDEETERGRSRVERAVVGKIFARKSVNRESLRQHLPRILRARGRTEIEMIGHNLFIIAFSLDSDRQIALEEGPWHFFQDLMILKQTKARQTPMEVSFDEITLWVQCHNVPMECMDPEIIRRIGGRIGKVEEVDEGEGGLCVGKFARIRVTRRIEEPLVRCVPLVHESLHKEVIVIIQYEKLPEFCFACGRVGHISRDCWDEKADKKEFQFDSWLRAGRSFVGRRSGETGIGVFTRGSGGENICRSGGGEEESRPVQEEKGNQREHEEGEVESGMREGALEVLGAINDVQMVVREESSGLERDHGGGGLEPVVGSKETMQSGELERSPGKGKKKNSRRGGKGWKRLARENKRDGVDGEMSEGELRETGEGKRRRGGGFEEGDGDEGPNRKQQKVPYEPDMAVTETAEAAKQPRREL